MLYDAADVVVSASWDYRPMSLLVGTIEGDVV